MNRTYAYEQWDVLGVGIATSVRLQRKEPAETSWEFFQGSQWINGGAACDWDTAERDARAEVARRKRPGSVPVYSRVFRSGVWRSAVEESGLFEIFDIAEALTDGQYAITWHISRSSAQPEGLVFQSADGHADTWEAAIETCRSLLSRLYNALG